MYIKLIANTPEPERVVGMACRECYSPLPPEKLAEQLSAHECEEIIRRVRNMGHTSTFEHVSFTFAISGVSRTLSHQLVRHRIASYSQRSQRYIDENGIEVVVPPNIANVDKANDIFCRFVAESHRVYKKLAKLGISKEDARFVLPGGACTDIIVTMNARTLLNFFKERTCARAQWEIRYMATLMLEQVLRVAPIIFEKAGASCVSCKTCTQDKLSCGDFKHDTNDLIAKNKAAYGGFHSVTGGCKNE